MSNPLILKYYLTDVLSVNLPIFDYTQLAVNWDTGVYDTDTKTHVYTTPGIKTITIHGNISELNCGIDESVLSSNYYITECVDFGDVGLTKISFKRAIRLTTLPSTLPSTVIDLSYLCANINFNQDISSWDTSNVSNFNNCFFNNPTYNKPVWTSVPLNPTSRIGMFRGASSFNQNIGLMSVSNTTQMDFIFKDTNISIENFTNAYKSWVTQSNLISCSFKNNLLIYTGDAESSRQQLITQYNWNIQDDILLLTPPIKKNKPITLRYNHGLWNPQIYGISIIIQNSSCEPINSSTTNLLFTNVIFPTSGRVIIPIYINGVSIEIDHFSVYVNASNVIQPNMTSMGSLFSNNASVYYKPHSLAPGGVGSVRNYRRKSKKT